MRAAQKKQILEFIENMHQAHGEIKQMVEKKNAAASQNMLCDLQELAVSFGEMLEAIEGEQCATIACVEKYCETIFTVFERVQNDSVGAHKVYTLLEQDLDAISESVNRDITIRREIVFFPYKASMWDSLESLYLDLKKDSNNDVYCVPIPYYDRNADLTLGQKHYEGREYPKNIEVFDYQTYNFEERCPDEIYIHNPYDDQNFVSVVEPRFFAENLKKYTDKLVYSPYFILREIEPDDQAAIDQMKNHVLTRGVRYADVVILQSEKMKQIYVNEYLKAAKNWGLTGKHVDRSYLEKKFQGTGSPKIERIRRMMQEEIDIPEKWKKIIYRENGSPKKVVLYNLSLASMNAESEKWINKLEDSLIVFRENREKIALLWRPHPLIESTLKRMRPALFERYMSIKMSYLQEGWGIFDDTSDADRAIVLSDAMFGDDGSLANLFQAIDKPVMYQNVWLLNHKKETED